MQIQNAINSVGNNYDWSKDDDIPTIDAMPEPNISVVNAEYGTVKGYTTFIDGSYYWAGRMGHKYSTNRAPSPLPVVPLGNEIPEPLKEPDVSWEPDLYPYNYNAFETVTEYEILGLNHKDQYAPGKIVQYSSGQIAKWIFAFDREEKKTYIFVNGIYSIETDLTFAIAGYPGVGYSYDNTLYWEDETTFYIRNYNILISTPKQPLYEQLYALECAPKIMLNDTILAFAEPPIVESDRTLVPMRFLFEKMGDTVSWDAATQSATVKGNNDVVTFSIDNTTAKVNGNSKSMDVPARLINNKTMIPLRFLSESLGYKVKWDEKANTVNITNEG